MYWLAGPSFNGMLMPYWHGMGDAVSDNSNVQMTQSFAAAVHQAIEQGLPLSTVDNALQLMWNSEGKLDPVSDAYQNLNPIVTSAQRDRDDYASKQNKVQVLRDDAASAGNAVVASNSSSSQSPADNSGGFSNFVSSLVNLATSLVSGATTNSGLPPPIPSPSPVPSPVVSISASSPIAASPSSIAAAPTFKLNSTPINPTTPSPSSPADLFGGLFSALSNPTLTSSISSLINKNNQPRNPFLSPVKPVLPTAGLSTATKIGLGIAALGTVGFVIFILKKK